MDGEGYVLPISQPPMISAMHLLLWPTTLYLFFCWVFLPKDSCSPYGLPDCSKQKSRGPSNLHWQEETEAVLLVDASNAFNSLNTHIALHNIGCFAQPWPPYLSIHTKSQLSCLWVVIQCILKEAQLRGSSANVHVCYCPFLWATN